MPRNTQSKQAKKAAVTAAPKKTRKARIGNIRESVIKALKGGSQSRPALQKATGASYNGLIAHLSKLTAEGVVTFDAANRIASLATAPTSSAKGPKPKSVEAAEAAPAPKSTSISLKPVVTAPVPVGYDKTILADALEQFVGRIQPIERFEDKLMVLEKLAQQIGGPISVVLESIKADLLRSAP